MSLSDSLYGAHENVLDDSDIRMNNSQPHLFDSTLHTLGRDSEYGIGPSFPQTPFLASDVGGERQTWADPGLSSAAVPAAGELQSHWVTVFGFPRSRTTDILHIFRQYGEFLDQKSSGGNWVHLCYATKLQAQQALAKNGKIINGDLMIGVVPCTDNTWLKPHHLSGVPTSVGPTSASTSAFASATSPSISPSVLSPSSLPTSSTGLWQAFWTHVFGY